MKEEITENRFPAGDKTTPLSQIILHTNSGTESSKNRTGIKENYPSNFSYSGVVIEYSSGVPLGF